MRSLYTLHKKVAGPEAYGQAITEDLYKPQEVVVRVYVLRGHDLRPHSSTGNIDPYVTAQLGRHKQGNRKVLSLLGSAFRSRGVFCLPPKAPLIASAAHNQPPHN